MPIQFFCVACRQPIEVDDEFANQTVTCPYCRKVVTAPAATDHAISENPPIAAPAEAEGPASTLSDAPATPAGTNKLSWAALGCASVMLVIWAILIGFQVSIYRGLPANTTPQQANKILADELSRRPGVKILSGVGSCALPLAAVVLGIIALVRRTPPRWPAITALVVCGLFVLLLCAGALLIASSAAGRGGG